jgi:N-acetylglucosamine-6-phosphate deacetylase
MKGMISSKTAAIVALRKIDFCLSVGHSRRHNYERSVDKIDAGLFILTHCG